MRRVVPVLVVVLLGGGGAFAWLRLRAERSAGIDLPTHVVGTGPIVLALKESGVVRPRQVVAVKSKVSGRVREILVAEGTEVQKGDLVAVVEPDAQVSVTLSQRRMELRRLGLEHDQKERAWERQRRLSAEGLTSAQVAEESERAWRSAETFYLQALSALNLLEREANQPVTRAARGDHLDRARVDVARVQAAPITDYRILAPIAGVVAAVKVKPGELTTSGTTGLSPEGALLMEIADQSTLEVHVDINEIDIARVHPGMAARVTIAARPEVPIDARVARVAVAPKLSESKLVVYPVVLDLPERPPELRQGMTASVDLTLDSVDDAMRIPGLSFLEKEGKTLVKIRDAEGGFADREVTLGLKGDRFVAVTSGLKLKDVIAARYPRPKDAE